MVTRTAATVSRVPDCDGFLVRSADGPLGLVEEAWLDTDGRVAALAVRLPDGLRGLLLAGDVRAVLDDDREVLTTQGSRLLELTVPRLEAAPADGRVAAHWETTGERIAAAPSRAAVRPRRIGGVEHEFRVPTRPLWQVVALVYAWIGVMVAAVIGLAFLVAYVVAGRPY